MKDAQATKLRIQTAALKLFVEQGIAETTTRDLAAAAAIAEGTLYRHYVSKEALVTDLFATHYQAYAKRLGEIERREEDARGKLAAMIADVYGLYDRDATLFRFLLLSQHQAIPRLPPSIESPVAVLRRVVERALERGELRALDPELLTAMALGLILQPAVSMTYGQLAPPLHRLAGTITAAVERALFAD